jgi:hypothetical protein
LFLLPFAKRTDDFARRNARIVFPFYFDTWFPGRLDANPTKMLKLSRLPADDTVAAITPGISAPSPGSSVITRKSYRHTCDINMAARV